MNGKHVALSNEMPQTPVSVNMQFDCIRKTCRARSILQTFFWSPDVSLCAPQASAQVHVADGCLSGFAALQWLNHN